MELWYTNERSGQNLIKIQIKYMKNFQQEKGIANKQVYSLRKTRAKTGIIQKSIDGWL